MEHAGKPGYRDFKVNTDGGRLLSREDQAEIDKNIAALTPADLESLDAPTYLAKEIGEARTRVEEELLAAGLFDDDDAADINTRESKEISDKAEDLDEVKKVEDGKVETT